MSKRCIQCENPHFDGICECGIGPTPEALKRAEEYHEKEEREFSAKMEASRKRNEEELKRINASLDMDAQELEDVLWND